MTDRRIKDLSYGRLGKPIYDAQIGWTFSQNTSLEQSIQRVLPLKEQLSPSIQAPQDGQRNYQPDFKSLVKKIPDLHPAEGIVKNLSRLNHDLNAENEGPLFSVGKGLDNDRLSGRLSTFPIFAMPHGDAGHILKIVRPRVEKRSWEKKSSVSIPLLLTESSDQGYYNIGSGGSILQVTFSNEEDFSGTWLAVRQSTTTTILRIQYSEDEDHSSILGGVSAIRHTNLMPFSVVAFPVVQSSDHNHADVAFNPLYNRQIALVDQSGRWSIWDYEPRHSKKTLPKLVAGKSGQILDDYDPDPILRIPEHSLIDGWHRIFWVCNLTTILVCSRTHLAVFDIKSNPSRLDSTEFLVSKGIEIILDIKRSAGNLNHVFVLTSSRIYWIEVVPPGENGDGSEVPGGVKMILSYRHFRNENDDTMRLTTLQDDFLSVFIYSRKNVMVNFYSFSIEKGEEISSQRQSAHGFFYLSGNDDKMPKQWDKSPKTIVFLPNTFEHHSNSDVPGSLGLRYLEGAVRFFQSFILTTDLGLSSALCAVGTDYEMRIPIEPPMVKISRTFRHLGHRKAIEGFIVHDGEVDTENDRQLFLHRRSSQKPSAFLMNWAHVYQSVFLHSPDDGEITSDKAEAFLPNVISRIQHGLEEDKLTMQTLLEMSSFKKLSENLEQISEALDDFFTSMPQDDTTLSDLVISNTSRCPGVEIPLEDEFKSVDLMKIYQDLVEKWITSLSLDVSIAVRGSKFRMIRQMTAELYFSSVAISLQSKSSKVPTILQEEGEDSGDVGFATRESSPATFYSAQMSLRTRQDPQSSLPTPTRTPSTYSRLTSASGLEEDPALCRLRQYAISIKPRPDVGKSKILSEWPTVPGVDPASYTYRAQADSDEDDSAPESAKSRRESARRKKRTEKFLERNAESSRRAVVPSGSQPVEAPQLDFSSQPTEDVPMTQPDRGTFGSRKAKGKKKQRTAGF